MFMDVTDTLEEQEGWAWCDCWELTFWVIVVNLYAKTFHVHLPKLIILLKHKPYHYIIKHNLYKLTTLASPMFREVYRIFCSTVIM